MSEPECDVTLTVPHPDFPGVTHISLTHVCGEDYYHDGMHKCRRESCGHEWETH